MSKRNMFLDPSTFGIKNQTSSSNDDRFVYLFICVCDLSVKILEKGGNIPAS